MYVLQKMEKMFRLMKYFFHLLYVSTVIPPLTKMVRSRITILAEILPIRLVASNFMLVVQKIIFKSRLSFRACSDNFVTAQNFYCYLIFGTFLKKSSNRLFYFFCCCCCYFRVLFQFLFKTC